MLELQSRDLKSRSSVRYVITELFDRALLPLATGFWALQGIELVTQFNTQFPLHRSALTLKRVERVITVFADLLALHADLRSPDRRRNG